MTTPDSPLYRYKAQVQAIQQAYSNVMAGHWERVTAAGLAEADYWRIADGPLLRDCQALIRAATAEHAAFSSPNREASA